MEIPPAQISLHLQSRRWHLPAVLFSSQACLNQSPFKFPSSAPEMSEVKRTSAVYSLLCLTSPTFVLLISLWLGQTAKLCLTSTFPGHLESIPFLWATFTKTSPCESWVSALQASHSLAERPFPNVEERSYRYD